MMKKFEVWSVGTMLLVALTALTQINTAASPEKLVIGLTVISNFNPFFLALRDGAKETIENAGGILLEHDSQQDVARQIAGMEEFIAQKVDAILLTAFDAKGLVPSVLAANEANIPVITVDTGVAGGNVASFVASDNVLAGKLCAQYLVDRLKQKKGQAAGQIVVLDSHPAEGVLLRIQGFQEVLRNYPDIKIVASVNGLGSRVDGFKAMEKALTAHAAIDAVFAINDPSGLGALDAIEAAGRQHEMFVVGVDGAKDALAAIKRGSAFVFTAAQDPVSIGKIGAEMAIKTVKGEPVTAKILIPVKPVSIENVDEYLPHARF